MLLPVDGAVCCQLCCNRLLDGGRRWQTCGVWKRHLSPGCHTPELTGHQTSETTWKLNTPWGLCDFGRENQKPKAEKAGWEEPRVRDCPGAAAPPAAAEAYPVGPGCALGPGQDAQLGTLAPSSLPGNVWIPSSFQAALSRGLVCVKAWLSPALSGDLQTRALLCE